MSERDKKLLGLLLVIAILALIYFIGYQPLNNRKMQLEENVASLESQLSELTVEYEKMPIYEKEIAAAEVRIAEIKEVFPKDLSQQRAFKLLFDVEIGNEEIDFENVTFSNMEALAYSNDLNNETTEVAVSRNITSVADLTYEGLKTFLKYVGDYPYRTVLSNLTMVLNEEENTIGTSFSMNMYGMLSGEMEVEEIDFSEFEGFENKKLNEENPNLVKTTYGNETPFGSEGVSSEKEGQSKLKDDLADIFVSLGPVAADGNAQIIGLMGDPAQRSYISTDKNSNVNCVIRIFLENETYMASYEIDGQKKERVPFDIQTALEIMLISTERLDDNDQVGMNLSIYNQTEVPLSVEIRNDDKISPRFNIIKQDGNVTIQ